MFHSKVAAFLLLVFLSRWATGEEIKSNTEGSKSVKNASYQTVSISYHSWVEKMNLDTSALTDQTFAVFGGSGLHYESQFFWGRTGLNVEVGLMGGTASAGGNTSVISYTAPKTTYWGAQTCVRGEYRTSPQISFALGPCVIYRQVKWDTSSITGLKATSGSDFNFAAVGELKLRLTANWDLRQELGAMAFNATTYWLMGVGYRF